MTGHHRTSRQDLCWRFRQTEDQDRCSGRFNDRPGFELIQSSSNIRNFPSVWPDGHSDCQGENPTRVDGTYRSL
jgi:hypothetical protein